MRAPGRRALPQCPVRPVRVVVIGVLAENEPEMPFTRDEHSVQALAAPAPRTPESRGPAATWPSRPSSQAGDPAGRTPARARMMNHSRVGGGDRVVLEREDRG
jgi:hypothetical protein